MTSQLSRFERDDRGAAAIEYVVLLLPLLALVFTALQIALAYHFSLTAQKAVELGARVAAVRDPVRTDLPETNSLDSSSGFTSGDSCANGACADPGGPWSCNGGSLSGAECDANAFNEIYSEVGRLAYLLDPEDVTITYSYGLLGYAEGPFVPIVEVEIAEKPFFLQFLFSFAYSGSRDDPEQLQLPGVAATSIAEDLSSDS